MFRLIPQRRLAFLVFGIALFARLVYVLSTDPYSTPDSDAYQTVAENIYQNFCVSRSNPAGAACAPSWGGNHLPGYPAVIAFAWLLGGKSVRSILILQSVLASLAAARLAVAIFAHRKRFDMAFAAGILLSLSPLEVGFTRSLLTETAAIATTEWVLAELILSLAERRLRLLSLGTALSAAIFMRYDGVLLCLLAAGVGFYLHPVGVAFRRGAILVLIVLLTLTLWAYRSVAVGLPYFPPVATAGHEWAPPTNMLRWGMTWIDTPEQEAEFIFPLLDGRYHLVKVPPSAYVSGREQAEVERQLGALLVQEGNPVPPEIDRAFEPLVTARLFCYPVTTFIYKPIARIFTVWGNINSSYGWPIGFGVNRALAIAEQIEHGGTGGLVAVILRYPFQAAGKAAISGYKFLVLAICLIAVFAHRKRSLAAIWEITALAGAYAIIRTAVLVSGVLPTIEIRIIAEAFPGTGSRGRTYRRQLDRRSPPIGWR